MKIFLLVLALSATSGSAYAESLKLDAFVPAECESLLSADFSAIPDATIQITRVNAIMAEADVAAHCLVKGYIAPNVGIKMSLPVRWNGKFMEMGCAVFCGEMKTDELYWTGCGNAVRKGYACIMSDMGHNGTWGDVLWAYDNLQAELDWGFRAAHVVAVAGKALAEYYYRSAPERSYFMGCSTGAREALQEAQRFPWDFDGIIAGAPPVEMSTLYLTSLWSFRATHDGDGKTIFTDDDLKLLHDAAIAKCDLDDPLHCSFNPAVLICRAGQTSGCLSSAKIAAAESVYSGPTNSKGQKLSLGGPAVGAELTWGREGSADLVANGFRYLFVLPAPGPSWRLSDFDVDRDYRRLSVMKSVYDSNNPDLRTFKAAGGKLLAVQGLNDSVIARQSTDYYETVQRTMGSRVATQDFFRLFTVPGMDHCAGGEGAFAIDYLSYLEGWVERGQAPDKMIGAHVDEQYLNYLKEHSAPEIQHLTPDVGAFLLAFPLDSNVPVTFTRPVFPYPIKARYNGRGDPNDAMSYGPGKQ